MAENTSTSAAATEPATDATSPRRQKLRRFAIVVAVAVVCLGLLLFYGPRYVARYLVAAELNELGIDYEGVETIEINLFTRELWLGPVRFGAGPSDLGQLGELGLTIRFNPLLQRQVSIERLLVRGIDVLVTRSADNAIAVNGIPLDQFRTPSETPEPPTTDEDPWGAGADILELRDSRLIFQDREQGDLEVDVERLAMTDFRTWEPQQPGRFELKARVNDIQLNWSGEARPFADNISFSIDSRTEQADVPKVVRFTGPLGLDRNDGTYDAALRYEVTLFDSGRLEGHTVGTIDIQGADYTRAGVFALAVERAKVDLDVRYTFSETGEFVLNGEVTTDLSSSRGALADDTRFAAATGQIALGGLEAGYAKNGTLTVDLQPNVALEGVEFTGPIEISVDKVLELLALLQSLSAGTDVSTADTGLGDFADNSLVVPSSDVKVGRLRSKGDKFSLRSTDGQVEFDLQTASDLFDIQIGVDERRINIERLQSALERLSVTSGAGQLALRMAGTNSLVMGTSRAPRGEINIGSFEAKVRDLGLQSQAGAVSLQLAAATQANGLSGLLYATGARPETQLHLGAVSATIEQSSVDAQGDALSWRAAGGAVIDALTAEFAKGEEGSLKFRRAELKALQADEKLQLAAEAMTIDGLDLYFKRSLLAALLEGDGKAVATKPTSGTDVAAESSEEQATTPAPATLSAKADVSRAQTLLTELGYAPGPVDGVMGRRTATALGEFQRREGLVADGRLTGSLLAALEARAAAPAEPAPAPAPRTAAAAPTGAKLRVGQVALSGKPVIRFRDDLVTPQVKIDTVFKEAQVRNLETQKTDLRTDVRILADVNEFTHVELTGWVNGLDATADLDLTAKVENLELSNYSPYIEALAGVYLDSGQLDTTTAGKAAQGGLQGEIQLELDDIVFRPLSKEDAERLAGKVGVPLETAVGLLQDDEGRIVLALPVRGSLNAPEVELKSAVNKAIGGALKKVFPPTMVASLLSGVAKGPGAAFEPIAFAPGSAELDAAGRSYADDVAEFLAEHPKLSLKVCGRSTAQDVPQLAADAADAKTPPPEPAKSTPKDEAKPDQSAEAAEALKELAVERKRAVRRYLITEKGADPKRVPECRSTFEAADQGSPRVEISL